MKTFLRILTILAILIIAFSIFIATRPSHYDVRQKKLINAPTSMLFNTINDYKTWMEWGPWKEMDSTIATSFSNKTSGVGAGYSWTSAQDGFGSMKTIALEKDKSIDQTLFFDNRDDSEMYWKFEPKDNATEVTWGVKGDLGFMGKSYFYFKGGAEKVFHSMLVNGLNNIDKYVQKRMDIHSITSNGIVEYTGGYYIYLSKECSFEDIGKNMDVMLPKVLLYAIGKAYPRAGAPFTVYHKYDEKNKTAHFSVCIPVKERVNPEGDIALAFMERAHYYKTTLKGAYKFSGEAWKKAFEFAAKDSVEIDEKGMPFEVYTKGHTISPNPADWLTEIYLPVK